MPETASGIVPTACFSLAANKYHMASKMHCPGMTPPLPRSSLLPAYIAEDKLFFSTRHLQNPALLIQPSLDLLVAVGETPEMRKAKARFDAVATPEDSQTNPLIVVPLGLETPYGLTLEQAEYTINRMSSDLDSHFVTRFFEHLCLDADIRFWINERMTQEPKWTYTVEQLLG